MGLDMYLTGKKYLPKNHDDPDKNEMEDGFRVSERCLELGYWRKHPDLHEFITETFGGDNDEITLDKEAMEQIIQASANRQFTRGLTKTEMDRDISIFAKAIEWLDKQDGSWKTVQYVASW